MFLSWPICLPYLKRTNIEWGYQKKEKDQETPQSFGKYLLERQQELELSDNETAYLAGSMFGAGSDTTASAISISIMAAACFPKAQAKVQEELDNVIGKERGVCF
jgi:cytochrome P450